MEVTMKKICEDTYVITENGLLGASNCYLLVGKKKALLIDTAYGYSNLKDEIKRITDKEVICVLTHGHMDHADGCCQFDNVYMHSEDRELFKKHTSFDFIQEQWTDGVGRNRASDKTVSEDVMGLLSRLKNEVYRIPEKLEKVDFIELGDRKVRWISIPGHTKGSVCYYDLKYNLLFTGDSITERVWLFLQESQEVSEYEENIKKLRDFIKTHGVSGIYPGHGGHSLRINAVEDLIACCDMYEEENSRGREFTLKVGSGKIFRKNEFRLLTK